MKLGAAILATVRAEISVDALRAEQKELMAEDVWLYEIKRMARLVFEATKEPRSDAEKLAQIRAHLNAAFLWGRSVGRLEDQ